MAKYYVSSGGLNEVITEGSPLEAAKKAMIRNHNLDEPTSLGLLCRVSETGFNLDDEEELCNDNDVYMTTDNVLRDCDIDVDYTLQDVIEGLSETGIDIEDTLDDIEDGIEEE